jgi:hypothetical protein
MCPDSQEGLGRGFSGLTQDAPRPPRVKEPLLKWWGIFPAAIFMGVEALFARPEAANGVKDGLDSVGYIVGGCLFGLVFSLMLAWIAYRLTGRSQLVATLIFSFALGFVGCGTVDAHIRNAAAARAQVADPLRRN